MKLIILSICAISCMSIASAQVIQNIDFTASNIPLQDVQMTELYADTLSNSMIVLAPTSFNKARMGAPTREQILILSGSARFTFDNKIVEAVNGTYLIIPANTPHHIAVSEEEILKMLVIQDVQ